MYIWWIIVLFPVFLNYKYHNDKGNRISREVSRRDSIGIENEKYLRRGPEGDVKNQKI